MNRRDIIEERLDPGLDALKLHLRITSSDQDALLLGYLKAAVLSAEHFIGRPLACSMFVQSGEFNPTLTLEGISDDFPVEEIMSVTVDGEEVTAYSTHGDTLLFDRGVSGGEYEVYYVAGGRKVLDDIRQAVLLTASKYFANPVDSVEALPSVASNLLTPYRRWKGK